MLKIESVANTASEVNDDQEENMLSEAKDTDKGREEGYLDISSAAYPSSRQEEEEFIAAYCGGNDSDSVILLDGSMP